ncbi:hypothetical protein ACOSQ3_027248 [Xanthoceras sorbifolium]
MLTWLGLGDGCCWSTRPLLPRGSMGSLNIKKSPLGKRVAETPLIAIPKKTKLADSKKSDQVLLLEDSVRKLSPLINGAYGKRKGIDFDSFAEQPVQKGMFGSSVVVGSAAYSSSSLGLGVVVKEYFKRAPMLYKEFLTRGLSQCIEEDEDPDLCHTLVYQALLLLYDSSSTIVNSSLFCSGISKIRKFFPT